MSAAAHLKTTPMHLKSQLPLWLSLNSQVSQLHWFPRTFCCMSEPAFQSD